MDIQPITVSIAKAEVISGLKPRKIKYLISSGTLRTAKVGNRRLIFYDSLRDYLHSQESTPARAP